MGVQRPNAGVPATFYTSVNSLCDDADSKAQLIQGVQDDLTALQGTVVQVANVRDQQFSSLSTRIDSTITQLRDEIAYAVKTEHTARLGDQETVKEFLIKRVDDSVVVLAKGLTDVSDSVRKEIVKESDNRANADNAISARLTAFIASVAAALISARPAVFPAAFGNTAIGAVADIAAVDPKLISQGSFGLAYQISGAGLLAPRAEVNVDPDSITIMRVNYWRETDVVDPNNNAVDVGVQWLDASHASLGTTILRRESKLRVQDGPRALTARIPSADGDPLSVVAPVGAVCWRPYLRTYGADGVTAVELLGTADATFAGVYAPDVYDITARLGAIEGKISAGLPFATPILPSYPVADLPAPGNRGRKAFASDGRAPDASGALEAAGAGTGVEVVDNSTAWVISGTNQQVQA